MNVVVRADASPTIGAGHVIRCAALADALISRGGEVTFAALPETAATMTALGVSGHSILVLSSQTADEPAELAERWPDGIDLLIVDHYGRGIAFESACRPWASAIAVIDDHPGRRHDCGVLIDQTCGRTAAAYSDWVPGTCRVLTGTDYALLRAPFPAQRADSLARRGRSVRIDRILVAFGGGENATLLGTVLSGVARSGIEAEIDIILGTGDRSREAWADAAAQITGAVRIHSSLDASAVAAMMASADLAVGAAGSMSWERCCLGLPSLVVIVADNQVDVAAALADQGAALNLGRASDLDANRIAEAIDGVSARPNQLAAMAEKAAALCDGLGTSRAAAALMDFAAAPGVRR